MAKTTITQVTDDIDGSKNATEVSFSLDGKSWTIDLSNKNRKKLEAALKPYMDAGTRANSSRSGRRGSKSSVGRRPDLQEIRAWAKQNGHQVSERGRISSSVIEAYDARQPLVRGQVHE
jgi:nucleoid-associated protein Lsr2